MNILDKIDKYLKEEKDEEYQKFFNAKLKEYGVSSPQELSKEDKKKFFQEIEDEWTGEE